jgi:hypothetical protein
VWRLTEQATDDERDAVVVALNFEPAHKLEWPTYIRARKVYEEWRAMLALEGRDPGTRRQADLKRELSMRFGLGADTGVVNRFIKMVEWAQDFEEHHISTRGRDPYEVQHQAARYFEYFDELSKGERGGVARALKQDDAFRELVFDLLYEDKFKNWRQIRDLRYADESGDALADLRKARAEPDTTVARDMVEISLNAAKGNKAEIRSVGANARIRSFTTWLEALPPKAFRDDVHPEVLTGLRNAMRLVEPMVESILGGDIEG